MELRRLLAEALGTFLLSLAVWASLAFAMPLATPIVAALTLGICVYTLGGISGAHLNPAVTIGLLSINKIKPPDAVSYIIAQFVGAIAAVAVGSMLDAEGVRVGYENALLIGLAEAIGTFILLFGVCSVVYKKVDDAAIGLVIGSSLLLGIFFAASVGNAVLNPAVAFTIGSFGTMYIFGPILGAIGGAWAYKSLIGAK
jgi:glycerol uptake facilitator protein